MGKKKKKPEKPERIDPYGVIEARCWGPIVYSSVVVCDRCKEFDEDSDEVDLSKAQTMQQLVCEYHWHGALWKVQIVFCSHCGKVAFRDGPSRS